MQVAEPSVAQISVSELVEPPGVIKGGSALVGDCLVVDKPIVASRVDGLLVKAHRLKISTFEAGDLRVHQRGAGFEILWAIRRPDLELSVVCNESLDMLCRWPGSTES
jgi:hypothetical protein